MELLRSIIVLIHIVGFAMLFGGWLAQVVRKERSVSVLMRIGLATMIASGLILAIPFPAGIELNYIKLGVKLAIALSIGATFGAVITRQRTSKPVPAALFWLIGALALANAGIALIWH
jgi:hypothetical protein